MPRLEPIIIPVTLRFNAKHPDGQATGPDGKIGVWRTIRGRRVFIEEGQSLEDAMASAGMGKKKEGGQKYFDVIVPSGQRFLIAAKDLPTAKKKFKDLVEERAERGNAVLYEGERPIFDAVSDLRDRLQERADRIGIVELDSDEEITKKKSR